MTNPNAVLLGGIRFRQPFHDLLRHVPQISRIGVFLRLEGAPKNIPAGPVHQKNQAAAAGERPHTWPHRIGGTGLILVGLVGLDWSAIKFREAVLQARADSISQDRVGLLRISNHLENSARREF